MSFAALEVHLSDLPVAYPIIQMSLIRSQRDVTLPTRSVKTRDPSVAHQMNPGQAYQPAISGPVLATSALITDRNYGRHGSAADYRGAIGTPVTQPSLDLRRLNSTLTKATNSISLWKYD